MSLTRTIPLSLHGAIEVIAAPAVMAAPFLLGLGPGAGVVAFAFGAVLLGLALSLFGERRALPLTTHAGFDYVLGLVAAAAGLVVGLTGDLTGMIFLVGVGAAQVALTATTRFSVRGA